MNRLITIKTSSYTLDLRVDYSNKEGRTMAESIVVNALNSEIVPEIHIVPVEEAVEASKVITTDVVTTTIPYDNSKETRALRAAAKSMGIKRLKWIVKEINGVKVRTIDRRTFNGRGRNRMNTTVSKILQS